MMRYSHFFAILFVAFLGQRAIAASYTWDNATGGNWNAAANWGGTKPGSTDTVTLGALANPYTVLLTDTESINVLDITSASATLSITAALTVNSSANISAGTLNLSGSSLTISGSMTVGSGAAANWTGGTLAGGSGGGTLYGTLTVACGINTLIISGNTLFNAGTLAWTGGAINSAQYGTVVLTNSPTGVINFQADGTAFMVGYSSTATLVNQGTISKTGGGLSPTSVGWSVDFRNGGVISAQVGVMNFEGGGILNNGTTTVT